MKRILILVLVPALLILSACQREYVNPNAATGEQVLASTDGLLGMIVGLRREYSLGATGALYNLISANGLSTKELYVINTGNGELAALEAGKQTLGGANSIISNIWTSCNLVKTNAQLVIDNAANATDPATSAGINAYAHFYKALALGTMAQFWEQAPAEVLSAQDFLDGKRAGFSTRQEVLEEAVGLLTAAAAVVDATAPSAYFTSKVGADLDIKNAIQALLARYSLMLGNYDAALAAAAKVDLSKKSVFKFEAANPNPVYRTALVTNNTYNGLNNFGLSGELAPDSADARIPFYLGANPATGVRVLGFFTADDASIPVYLPGEILLIQAEAYARKNELANAIAKLDAVRTKSSDIFNVTAKLPAYSGAQTAEAVLAEIYRNRCIELYMSGMKLEDSRRFARPGPNDAGAERSRNFYPYPIAERDNNPNTPADPAI
jgi:hypothetical protein